jgi:hypothetical protein
MDRSVTDYLLGLHIKEGDTTLNSPQPTERENAVKNVEKPMKIHEEL